MFQTAELGRTVDKAEYKKRVPRLREALISAQAELRTHSEFPVIVLFGGVDGAGKGDVVNALNQWLDPRWVVTRAFDQPSDEEQERPDYWRFWRALPPKGQIGLLMSAWYSRPLVERVRGGEESEFERSLESIIGLEQQLADDGACIVKFWLHLGKKGQEKRFKKLEKDPLQAWRVTKSDWENWERYDDFVATAERIIGRTSTGSAPWNIVEGLDPNYASLRVGEILLESIESKLAERAAEAALEAQPATSDAEPAIDLKSTDTDEPSGSIELEHEGVLSSLDMTKKLGKAEYTKLLALHQGRLNRLQKEARDRGISTVLVFEGWDAAGKGGAIRRISAALDSRAVRVIPVAAPTDEERAHHYLWRFWRHLSRAGHITIFDRSWYGRVLVERVEDFASEKEWRRAYAEINRFEQQLVDGGTVLLKFWVHLTKEEQLSRFREREKTPYKRWKLTDEDWRNRERWDDYDVAVHDMVERTSTSAAPWILVEGNDKRYARVKTLEEICKALEEALGSKGEGDDSHAGKKDESGKNGKNGKKDD